MYNNSNAVLRFNDDKRKNHNNPTFARLKTRSGGAPSDVCSLMSWNLQTKDNLTRSSPNKIIYCLYLNSNMLLR